MAVLRMIPPSLLECRACERFLPIGDFRRNNKTNICKACQRGESLLEAPAAAPTPQEPAQPAVGAALPSTPAVTSQASMPRFIRAGGYAFNPACIAMISFPGDMVKVFTTVVEVTRDGYAESQAFPFNRDEAADVLAWLDGNSEGSAGRIAELQARIAAMADEQSKAGAELLALRSAHANACGQKERAIELVRLMTGAHAVMSGGAACGCTWCIEARSLLEG